MMPARPPMTALRQRMQDDLHLRHYAPQTLACSLRCVAPCAQDFRTSPDRLGPEQVRPYQLSRVQEQHVSWSVVIQTVCALRFFSTLTLGQPQMLGCMPQPKRPNTLPTILRQAEVAAWRRAPSHLQSRAMLTTLYAAGLRVSERCPLQGRGASRCGHARASASVAPLRRESCAGGGGRCAPPPTAVRPSELAHDQSRSPCEPAGAPRAPQSPGYLTAGCAAGATPMTRPPVEVADGVRQYGADSLAR